MVGLERKQFFWVLLHWLSGEARRSPQGMRERPRKLPRSISACDGPLSSVCTTRNIFWDVLPDAVEHCTAHPFPEATSIIFHQNGAIS